MHQISKGACFITLALARLSLTPLEVTWFDEEELPDEDC